MRISTLHIFNLANNSMADANRELVKIDEQLSTGRRVITAADDPVAGGPMDGGRGDLHGRGHTASGIV